MHTHIETNRSSHDRLNITAARAQLQSSHRFSAALSLVPAPHLQPLHAAAASPGRPAHSRQQSRLKAGRRYPSPSPSHACSESMHAKAKAEGEEICSKARRRLFESPLCFCHVRFSSEMERWASSSATWVRRRLAATLVLLWERGDGERRRKGCRVCACYCMSARRVVAIHQSKRYIKFVMYS